MQALHTYVMFEAIVEKKESVIITTDTPKKWKATVISVGSKCSVLSIGDTIVIPRYADTMSLEGKEYMICKEEDITVKL